MKKIISTSGAPAAIGPYSQAIQTGDTLYISGQIPVDPADGSMPSSAEGQTLRCLENVKAILDAAGYGVADIVKCTVLLDDMGNFNAMNEVYGNFFGDAFPARVCYQVCKLPKEAKVEIEATAVKRAKT